MQELFCRDPLSFFSNAFRILLHKANLNPFSYWKIGHYHCYTNKLVQLFIVSQFSLKKNGLYILENFFPSKYFANMLFVLVIWMNIFIFSWIFSHNFFLFSHWIRISGCHFFTLWTDASTNQLRWCVEQILLPLSPQPWPAHYMCLSAPRTVGKTRNPPVHPELALLQNTFSYLSLSLEDKSPSICFLVFLMQIHVAAGLKSFYWNILHPHT